MSIRHIFRHQNEKTRQKYAYCGYEIKMFDFSLQDIGHALACIETESYTQPCKKCWKAAQEIVAEAKPS